MMQTTVANSSIATDIVSFFGTFYMSDRIKNTFMMCIYAYRKGLLFGYDGISVTDKSPKKFRYTLVSRLQNYSISIIESLLTANEIRVMDRSGTVIKERLEQQCILPKQYEQITKALYDCQNIQDVILVPLRIISLPLV